MAPDPWKDVIHSVDPAEIFETLDQFSKDRINKWKLRRQILIQDRIRDELNARLEEESLDNEPSVPFLSLTVNDRSFRNTARLTIWRPSENQLESLRTGNRVLFFNVTPKGELFDEQIQLSINGKSRFQVYTKDSSMNSIRSDIGQLKILSRKKLTSGLPRFEVSGVCTSISCAEHGWTLYLMDRSRLSLAVFVPKGEHQIKADILAFKDSLPITVLVQNLLLLPPESRIDRKVRSLLDHSSKLVFPPELPEEESLDAWYSKLSLTETPNNPLEDESQLKISGFIDDIIVLASKELLLSIDVCNSRSQVVKVPLGLVRQITENLSDDQPVVFRDDLERRLADFSCLNRLYRLRNKEVVFLVEPSNLGPSGSYEYIAKTISVVD